MHRMIVLGSDELFNSSVTDGRYRNVRELRLKMEDLLRRQVQIDYTTRKAALLRASVASALPDDRTPMMGNQTFNEPKQMRALVRTRNFPPKPTFLNEVS